MERCCSTGQFYHFLNELSMIFEVGKLENWVLSENDLHVWKTGYGKDNFNLLVAVDRKSNKTIGSITSALYVPVDGSEPLVTIGMFFVCPSHRGTGLGLTLFERILKDDRFDGLNWGLNGVPTMSEKYAKKYGFDKYNDWNIKVLEIPIGFVETNNLMSDKTVQIVDVKDIDIEQVLSYDFDIQGKRVKRDGMVKSLLRAGNSYNKVALNEFGQVVGYCNIRTAFSNQLSMGPLYANNSSIAETLVKTVLESIPNFSEFTNLWIFPTDLNKQAINLANKLSNGNLQDHGIVSGQFTKSSIQASSNFNKFTSRMNDFRQIQTRFFV